MTRRETTLVVAFGVCAAIAGLGYWLGVFGPSPEPGRGSAELAILEASRDKPGDLALNALFDELNTQHFAGRLPTVKVVWEEALDRLDIGESRLNGMTDGRIILLKPALQPDDAEIRRTLCHEMVHVKLLADGARSTAHDDPFQTELRRVFQGGCFHAILASEEEEAALKAWIDAERARLDAARAQVDAQGAAVKLETERVDRTFADLNERIRIANEAGSGWPSPQEIDAAEQQRAALNDRILAYNAIAAARDQDQARFNEAVERYNLMLAYPDGLAEDRAKGRIR